MKLDMCYSSDEFIRNIKIRGVQYVNPLNENYIYRMNGTGFLFSFSERSYTVLHSNVTQQKHVLFNAPCTFEIIRAIGDHKSPFVKRVPDFLEQKICSLQLQEFINEYNISPEVEITQYAVKFKSGYKFTFAALTSHEELLYVHSLLS